MSRTIIAGPLRHKRNSADREAACIWIEENQLGRRNLSDSQRGVVCGELANRLTALSKKTRAAEAGKIGGKNHAKVSLGNSALPELKKTEEQKERVAAKVAKDSNVPLRKVRDGMELAKRAESSPDIKKLKQKVLDGEMPLTRAANGNSGVLEGLKGRRV